MDKVCHFLVGLVLTLILSKIFRMSNSLTFSIILIIALGKEMFDMLDYNSPLLESCLDIGATMIPATINTLCELCLTKKRKRGRLYYNLEGVR